MVLLDNTHIIKEAGLKPNRVAGVGDSGYDQSIYKMGIYVLVSTNGMNESAVYTGGCQSHKEPPHFRLGLGSDVGGFPTFASCRSAQVQQVK